MTEVKIIELQNKATELENKLNEAVETFLNKESKSREDREKKRLTAYIMYNTIKNCFLSRENFYNWFEINHYYRLQYKSNGGWYATEGSYDVYEGYYKGMIKKEDCELLIFETFDKKAKFAVKPDDYFFVDADLYTAKFTKTLKFEF